MKRNTSVKYNFRRPSPPLPPPLNRKRKERLICHNRTYYYINFAAIFFQFCRRILGNRIPSIFAVLYRSEPSELRIITRGLFNEDPKRERTILIAFISNLSVPFRRFFFAGFASRRSHRRKRRFLLHFIPNL